MKKMVHTRKDAEYCLWYFRKHINKRSKLVGSFGKGKDKSNHDIDILCPKAFGKDIGSGMRKVKYAEFIKGLIDAKSFQETDWGGLFFHESIFGNVDLFFDISEFDY